MCAGYEKSYESFEAAKPDPEQEQKVTEEKKAKEALAKQLKQEEVLHKQEAEAAAKAEEDRVKKELRNQVVMSEQAFKESLGMYKNCQDICRRHD